MIPSVRQRPSYFFWGCIEIQEEKDYQWEMAINQKPQVEKLSKKVSSIVKEEFPTDYTMW